MSQKTLLLVDDEQGIRESLKSFFERYLYNILEAENGQQAIEKAENGSVDLILLDLMLPDMYGIDVCKQIRRTKPNIPIICLTAVTDPTETVLGFEAGADDYVEKPFNPHVLLARIKAKLKSTSVSEEAKAYFSNGDSLEIDDYNCIKFGKWIYYPKKSLVTLSDNSQCHLTDKENMLLKLLLSDPKKTFDRNIIAEHLNLTNPNDLARDVNIHVHRLRNKLTLGHNSASPIKAVRSQGYTLDSYLNYTFDGKELLSA